MRRLLIFALAGVAWTCPVYGQGAPPTLRECFRDETVRLFLDQLDAWNRGELKLARDQFERDFFDHLEQRLKTRPLGYEDPLWARRAEAMWRALPATLERKIPLNPGAQTVLVGFFLEQSDEFAKQFGSARPPAARQLQYVLFIVLSFAQEDAARQQLPAIPPSSLFQALARSWTHLWPLCPRARVRAVARGTPFGPDGFTAP